MKRSERLRKEGRNHGLWCLFWLACTAMCAGYATGNNIAGNYGWFLILAISAVIAFVVFLYHAVCFKDRMDAYDREEWHEYRMSIRPRI